MALSNCCRYTLVPLSAFILLTGAAMMFLFGITFLAVSRSDKTPEEVKKSVTTGCILISFGIVVVVLIPVVLWIGFCFRRRAPACLFVFGLVMTVIIFLGGAATMLAFGIMYIWYTESRGTALPYLLLVFGVLAIIPAIVIPIYCCRRRKRQIHEEEMNELTAQIGTEATHPVVFLHDGK